MKIWLMRGEKDGIEMKQEAGRLGHNDSRGTRNEWDHQRPTASASDLVRHGVASPLLGGYDDNG